MAESQTVSDAIAAVLPDLPDHVLKSVEDTLKALGAVTADDLQYITEVDLLPVLKPVQARRLVAAWAQNKSSTPTPAPACSSQGSLLSSSSGSPVTPSRASSTATSSSESCSPRAPNWLDTFQIPWQKLSEELVQNLERQKRPSPRLRREMIRIVVSEMMKICKNPTKQNTTEIAKRMVARYPRSLQDVIDGDIIGLGYHSLAKQLQSRVENVKRPDTPKIKRRNRASDDDTDEISVKQRAHVQDTYGCVNWMPKHLPLPETVTSQSEKKEKMKTFEEINFNSDAVKELIKSTYFTQRKDINNGESIKNLSHEWPFLFHFVEKTSLAEEVQMDGVPPTPCLIVCGSSCFAAETFMLSIDNEIVNDCITSFTSAICLMFGSYYCFNIHYPVELRSTLEFLQRCFFSINPEKGTKVEWKKKKKVFSVNPRVFTLISDLADHEWTFQ
ncbi:uncharacterized protein LOC119021087 isoform X2 [Acanthopagrus latus]|uniref:uncharacterized protein LOC119021061 isoform X4 n=1 Tax=Acanthopagrus latus TaxID=8177 RepID=UPI00187C6C3E|nr:uncharacterized protein LOC119021061 isoform X4 [Acanthopagrus latus]XP_036956969.1 uncharacterized protein LOC119021087 isoform X2 [Acanthopagrus latus]